MYLDKAKRRALIIHNSGGVQDHLPGVRRDIENIQAFLKSDCGGAWDDHEITVAPDDCSRNWLIDYFYRGNAAFYMIFFVGHGTYEIHQGVIYCLPSGENAPRTWIRKLTKDIPTLLVTDSCQVIEQHARGGRLTESVRGTSVTDSTKRDKCRKAYDDALRGLPYGMFVTASSVLPGQEAREDSQRGGYYISSLIEAAKDIERNPKKPIGVYGIVSVHTDATQKVGELSDGKQTPSLEGYTRSHQPPFVVKM